MADVPDAVARFDHVTPSGALAFTAGGREFLVEVDDTLERALLEAKQILSEQLEEKPAPHAPTLPISQIQSLIRAGADPDQVAQRYALSAALVRRFSASVEAEKKNAIEQFLCVPAPRESRMRTISDLIDRTLAAARVLPGSVKWKATRRGHEPWQISATFQSGGHDVVAHWSWNMHDNAVTCENNAASTLLGERIPAEETAAKKNAQPDVPFPVALDLPGDSARSARIEMTVSSWRRDEDARSASQRDDERMKASKPDQPSAPESSADGMPSPGEAAGAGAGAPAQGDSPATGAQQPAAARQEETAVNTPAAQEAVSLAGEADGAPSDADGQAGAATEKATKQRRHSGRSAVPSWDEILFG